MPPLLTRRASLLLAPAALFPLGACSSGGPRSAYDLEKLPPYEGEQAALFVDTIEPSSLGLSMAQLNLQFDGAFQKRVLAADVISRVVVTTVTVSKADDKAAFSLRFASQRDFKGTLDEDLVDLRVTDRQAQPFSILNTIQAKARGKTVIGLWKRFRDKNSAAVHFYLAPDNDDTAKAVSDGLALGALKSQ